MNETPNICPMCEKGHLAPATHELRARLGERTITVRALEHYVCDHCGADPVFTDQIRRNERRIADTKRRADGLLAGDDIRAIRERFGLTQQDAAALFGGGTNAFSKYERGSVIQSIAMDRLLRLTAEQPALLDQLRALAPATPVSEQARVAEPAADYRSP